LATPSRSEPAPTPAPLAEARAARIDSAPAAAAVETPAPTPVLARKTARPSRLPLYVGAGVAAALVIGGGLWFALRPDAAPTPAAPGPAEPNSKLWMYHSHADEIADTYAGLVGGLVVTRRGAADDS
jgi:hypothetical protein